MINETDKFWIDNASYEEMLYKWRFEPIGSPWFTGDIGDYFSEVFKQKRSALSDEEHSRISKWVGWGK